jgi:hypothetical protein
MTALFTLSFCRLLFDDQRSSMERHALDPPGRAQTRPFPSLSCLDLAKGGLKRGSDRSLGLCCRRRHCAGSWSRSNNYVRPLSDERKQTRDFPRRPESDSGSLDREARSTYHHIDDIDLSDIALSSRSSVISFTIYHKIANIEPPLIIPVHLNRRHIILLSHISPQHHTPFSVRDITLLSQINPQRHSRFHPSQSVWFINMGAVDNAKPTANSRNTRIPQKAPALNKSTPPALKLTLARKDLILQSGAYDVEEAIMLYLAVRSKGAADWIRTLDLKVNDEPVARGLNCWIESGWGTPEWKVVVQVGSCSGAPRTITK